MIRCHVSITTYNRGKMLEELLNDIQASMKKCNVEVKVYVHDDRSDPEHSLVANRSRKRLGDYDMDIFYTYRMFHGGKKEYWITVNDIFREARQFKSGWDYFFLLQDDLRIGPSFFSEMIKTWEEIKDERIATLNPLMVHSDQGKSNWTGIKPERITLETRQVYKVGWTDCIFMSDAYGLNALGWGVMPIPKSRWERNPNLSSGVGQQMSQRLVKFGCTMYQVVESLVYHGDHNSLMNPEERKNNPIIS